MASSSTLRPWRRTPQRTQHNSTIDDRRGDEVSLDEVKRYRDLTLSNKQKRLTTIWKWELYEAMMKTIENISAGEVSRILAKRILAEKGKANRRRA